MMVVTGIEPYIEGDESRENDNIFDKLAGRDTESFKWWKTKFDRDG